MQQRDQLIENDEKKRLVSNIFSLGFLQATTYILPLLTVPYLVRVLGPEYFGLLAFATATISYFALLTDYGFNLSATRQISIHRSNVDKLSEIFSAVIILKIILMVISFILMSLVVLSFDKFSEHWEVFLITYGLVLGQTIFPVWLFQGMESMKHITFFNIIAKGFFAACIFIFVHEQNDYLLVPLFTSMGFILVGIWSFYLAKSKFNVVFSWQSTSVLKHQLVEGWYVFISTIAISLYTISTTFILGLFTNNMVVGYYSAADKIVHAVKGIYVPVSRAIYPVISIKVSKNKSDTIKFLRKFALMAGAGMFAISAIQYHLADLIVKIIMGDQYEPSILLLKIMAFLPFLVALSNIFGIQTMLNLGFQKSFSVLVFIGASVGMLLALVLVPIYGAVGAAVGLLITEALVTVMLGLFVLLKVRKEFL